MNSFLQKLKEYTMIQIRDIAEICLALSESVSNTYLSVMKKLDSKVWFVVH